MLDEKTKQASGIDWDINKAVLDWMGVKTIKLRMDAVGIRRSRRCSPSGPT